MDKLVLNAYKNAALLRLETDSHLSISPSYILELIDCIEKSERQMDAYRAYINGSIIRSELDKVLNDD